jgi:hypothetical protein
MPRRFLLLLGLLSTLVTSAMVLAGPSGSALFAPLPGGQAAGGAYALRGIAGQPGAGRLTGGGYVLSGGLLSPATSTPDPTPSGLPSPTAVPSHTPPPTASPSSTPAASPTPGQPAPVGSGRLYLPLIALNDEDHQP